MTTGDFLALYDAKVAEYLLAVFYLLAFVPMWHFVHGKPAVKVTKESKVEIPLGALLHH